MPVDMSLLVRDGKNLIADALSAAAVSDGGENLLVVFILVGFKLSKQRSLEV